MNDDETEKLKELVMLQHKVIRVLLILAREKLEKETEFWTSVKKELEQEVKNGSQQ